jgi:hypothetical protein
VTRLCAWTIGRVVGHREAHAVFNRADVKRWRRVVHKELRWLRCASEDPVYRAAMVLAAVYCFGTDVGVIAEASGQPEAFVRQVLKASRKERVIAGQTIRAAWNGKHGVVALMLDAMVATGDLYRPPDPKRSAAAKARKQSARPQKPRAPRTKMAAGAVFTPKVTKSDPLYNLAERRKAADR